MCIWEWNGEPECVMKYDPPQARADAGRTSPWVTYAWTAAMVLGTTLVLKMVGASFELVNIALLYLPPVLLSAIRWGRGPSVLAAMLGVVVFDFFFVPPIDSFSVSDLRYVISFAVFLTVALLTANLASRLRSQVDESRRREAHAQTLYMLSREMAFVSTLDEVLNSVTSVVGHTLDAGIRIYIPQPGGELKVVCQSHPEESRPSDAAVATWVHAHARMAGRGTQTLRESPGSFVPIAMDKEVYGVMEVQFLHDERENTRNALLLAQSFAGLAALAIARIRLEEQARMGALLAESERLRAALLDSISHELRTPLATIIGSTTGLLDNRQALDEADEWELLVNIREGALRMNRLVTNLLGMVRLESGMVKLHRAWSDLTDIIGVAMTELQEPLKQRTVEICIPDDLEPVSVDEVLMGQVLVNILSNAVKYSAVGSPIRVVVKQAVQGVTVSVEDGGRGIRPEEREKVFGKFYRGESASQIPGTGLGLAICKGIVEAHGGRIRIQDSRLGGAAVVLSLPATGTAAR